MVSHAAGEGADSIEEVSKTGLGVYGSCVGHCIWGFHNRLRDSTSHGTIHLDGLAGHSMYSFVA